MEFGGLEQRNSDFDAYGMFIFICAGALYTPLSISVLAYVPAIKPPGGTSLVLPAKSVNFSQTRHALCFRTIQDGDLIDKPKGIETCCYSSFFTLDTLQVWLFEFLLLYCKPLDMVPLGAGLNWY